MTDNPKGAIETMREELQAGEYDISEADRECLLELSDQIRLFGPSEFSVHRHEFLLRRGLVVAKRVGGLADTIEDRSHRDRHRTEVPNGVDTLCYELAVPGEDAGREVLGVLDDR